LSVDFISIPAFTVAPFSVETYYLTKCLDAGHRAVLKDRIIV